MLGLFDLYGVLCLELGMILLSHMHFWACSVYHRFCLTWEFELWVACILVFFGSGLLIDTYLPPPYVSSTYDYV